MADKFDGSFPRYPGATPVQKGGWGLGFGQPGHMTSTDKALNGALLGGAIGGSFGLVFGAFTGARTGARGMAFFETVAKSTISTSAAFATFLSVGTLIRSG